VGVIVAGALVGGATGAGGAASAPAGSPAELTLPAQAGQTAAALAASLARLPAVARSVTDGHSEVGLYRTAIALSRVAASPLALRAKVARAEALITAAGATARTDDAAAQAAAATAASAALMARAAAGRYRDLKGGVEAAALRLYMSGSVVASSAATTKSVQQLAWAQAYLETVVEPSGALAARAAALGTTRAATLVSATAKAKAAEELTAATAQLARVRATTADLEAQLTTLEVGNVAAVLADHQALVAQEATELISPEALEFTPSKALPAPLSTTAVALTWAFAELSRPYLWGGTGPTAFDCSGLMQFIWKKAGVSIPRVAAAQDSWSDPVPLSQLIPGDLVFYGTDDIHHVGMYIGAGLMINAPHTGTVVQVSSIWWSDLAGFGRVHAAGTPTASHVLPSASHPAPKVTRVKKPVPSETKPPARQHGRKGWRIPRAFAIPTPTTVPAPPTTVPSPPTTVPSPTTTVPSPTTVPSSTTTLPPSSTDPSSTTTLPPSSTDPSSTTTVPAQNALSRPDSAVAARASPGAHPA
jgi:cell wall-associated NlpC family hydrolase